MLIFQNSDNHGKGDLLLWIIKFVDFIKFLEVVSITE
jgi:hypothetical protein